MKTKFTKGDWFVYNEDRILSGDEGIGIDCKTDKGSSTIVLFGDSPLTDVTNQESLANAKLIAAAPDLLEACERARYAIRFEIVSVAEVLDILDNAIKKATE